jgi:hypothetical protein
MGEVYIGSVLAYALIYALICGFCFDVIKLNHNIIFVVPNYFFFLENGTKFWHIQKCIASTLLQNSTLQAETWETK